MFVTAVRQPVTPAMKSQGLYPEAKGVNCSYAGQEKSSFDG